MRMLDAINRLFYEYSLDELRQMNDSALGPNISHNSLLYLDLIYYRDRCTVSELARMLHISKSAVTSKVGELIRQGLVQKTQSESDRRVYHLTVTPEVRAEYADYDKRLGRAMSAVAECFPPEQVDAFCDMLDLIRESFLEEPG